jgi:hypothetical protein
MATARYHLVGGEIIDVRRDIPEHELWAEVWGTLADDRIEVRRSDGVMIHVRGQNVAFVEYLAEDQQPVLDALVTSN